MRGKVEVAERGRDSRPQTRPSIALAVKKPRDRPRDSDQSEHPGGHEQCNKRKAPVICPSTLFQQVWNIGIRIDMGVQRVLCRHGDKCPVGRRPRHYHIKPIKVL